MMNDVIGETPKVKLSACSDIIDSSSNQISILNRTVMDTPANEAGLRGKSDIIQLQRPLAEAMRLKAQIKDQQDIIAVKESENRNLFMEEMSADFDELRRMEIAYQKVIQYCNDARITEDERYVLVNKARQTKRINVAKFAERWPDLLSKVASITIKAAEAELGKGWLADVTDIEIGTPVYDIEVKKVSV